MKNYIPVCTRILLLITSLSIFLTLSSAQSDTITFINITDTHIISNLTIYNPGIAKMRNHYSSGNEPFKQFLTTCQENENCDFVVITGDLIDFYEAETTTGEIFDFQVEEFVRLISNIYVPLFFTLGNHDICTYTWKGGKVTGQSNAGKSKAAWIRNVPCFKDGTYYSHIFQVDTTSYRFIFLDNSYDRARPEENSELLYIDKHQMNWFENQLKQSSADIEIVLMHKPFTVINGITTSEENELLDILRRNPSVKLILAGHYHQNNIRELDLSGEGKIIEVQTAAFGRDPENWRIIKLTGNQILVSGTGKTEIELKIPVTD